MSRATVVGAGPNGLACAAALARAGLGVTVLEAADEIGGGTRTSELTVPGLLHDHCSAVHPMAAGSPFLNSLGLERHGLEWAWPEIDLAHPLDGGAGATMVRSLDDTAAGLEDDGERWRRLFGAAGATLDVLNDDLMRPVLHVPRHPVRLVDFGLRAAAPATALARALRTREGRALFGGVAAHAISRLDRPMSSAVGVALIAACHRFGWPVAVGGSRSITDALAADVREHGGMIETGVRVRSLADAGADGADAVVFDLSPSLVAEICGERLPSRVARAYRRYRHGPGAFKLDLAVKGAVPWAYEPARRAGTVHVAGDFDEIAAGERDIARGRMPERPYVLVAQQHVADPTRSAGDTHPLWAYAHVPPGYTGNATEAILAQIERFAPGFRERVVATAERSPALIEAENSNLIGGDIIGGANTPWQTVIRPRLALDPYSTGIPGVYMCSASTPPGAGVHGMCGANAARSALRHLGLAE